jgi:alpha-tubulin suppressor-like RCC1 family protein
MLVAGDAHTCGLATGGTAHCWGRNWYGQLGGGTSGTDRMAEVAVSGGLTFTAIVAGERSHLWPGHKRHGVLLGTQRVRPTWGRHERERRRLR